MARPDYLSQDEWVSIADLKRRPGDLRSDLNAIGSTSERVSLADHKKRVGCELDETPAIAELPKSGNPAGSSRTQRELRRQRRNTEKAFVDAVAIQLEITAAAAAELCRRGLVAPGHERDPQAVATGVLEAAARYLGLKEVPDPGIPIIPRG
jgi:hypothetical protein